MNTRLTQVEIIVYKIVDNEPLFLLAKRVPKKGGFWQPITGGVHENESLANAAKRELIEETQINDCKTFIENVHYFEFGSKEEGWLKEYVFGVEVDKNVDAKLSDEHTEKQWVRLNDALNILKYDSNKEAFKKLYNKLTTKN